MLQNFLSTSNSESILTPREKSVVQLIAEGRTNKEMAELLCLSAKTIESHRASVLQKLNLLTTADIIRYAVRNNLVDG